MAYSYLSPDGNAQPETKVKYSSHTFNDVIEGYSVKVYYDYYEHDRQCRIVTLKVETNYESEYLEEIVIDLIQDLEGKTTLLETKMEII